MIAWSPAMPAYPRCPHRRLRRLLMRELPHGSSLDASTFRPWASACFVGARHIFACGLLGGEAEAPRRAIAAHLESVEWQLAGHIVADVAVDIADGGEALRIEMLTVED